MGESQGNTVELSAPGFMTEDVSAATEFFGELMAWSDAADTMPLSSLDVDGGVVPASALAAADHVSDPSITPADHEVVTGDTDATAPSGWLAVVQEPANEPDAVDSLWQSLVHAGN